MDWVLNSANPEDWKRMGVWYPTASGFNRTIDSQRNDRLSKETTVSDFCVCRRGAALITVRLDDVPRARHSRRRSPRTVRSEERRPRRSANAAGVRKGCKEGEGNEREVPWYAQGGGAPPRASHETAWTKGEGNKSAIDVGCCPPTELAKTCEGVGKGKREHVREEVEKRRF